MYTKKGYIVPIILIILLLVLAGFFVFTSKPVESPVEEAQPVDIPNIKEPINVSTTTEEEDLQGEDFATTTDNELSTTTTTQLEN